MAPKGKKVEKPAEEEKKQKATKVKKTKRLVSDDSEEEEVQEPQDPQDKRDIVIAKLQEEISLLKIEVSSLRKHVGKISPIAPDTPVRKPGRSNSVAEAPPATPKGRRTSVSSNKGKDKGCSCKGNCANKICGCVKKDFYCLPTCKCSDACQNQDPDENTEDKENEPNNSENEMEADSSSAQSSPEVQKERQKSSKTAPVLDKDDFNPMAPRRQLARSPSTTKAPKEPQKSKPNHPALNEIPLPPPKYESDEEEEELAPPEEINNPEVDWEKHISELVQCYKCKRGFFPHRLKKHEKSCIKV